MYLSEWVPSGCAMHTLPDSLYVSKNPEADVASYSQLVRSGFSPKAEYFYGYMTPPYSTQLAP